MILDNKLNITDQAELAREEERISKTRAKEMFETREGREMLRAWGIDDKYTGVGNCILGYPDCPHPEARPRKEGYVVRV